MWLVAGVVGLVMLVCVAIYIPAVQKFVIDKTSAIVSAKTGWGVTMERFRLRFPLGVSVRDVTVMEPAGDTLARVGRVKVGALLMPLLKGRVEVTGLGLDDAHVFWSDSVSGMELRAHIVALGARGGSLDMATGAMALAGAVVDGGEAIVVMGEGSGEVESEPPATDTLPMDMNITVGRFELRDFAFSLDMPADSVASVASSSTAAPFDYRHIRATGAGVVVRDAGFVAGDIVARFEGLRLAERSGLVVKDGRGDFAMTDEEISITDLVIESAGSSLSGSVVVGAGIVDFDPATPVSVTVSAAVATDEIALVAPLPQQFAGLLAGRTVTLGGTADGTLDNVALDGMTVALLPEITMRAHGSVRGVTTPERLSGSVTFDGELADLDAARTLIADTALRRRVAIPHGATIRAGVEFSPESYDLKEFTLRADSTGSLHATGRYLTRTGSYEAEVGLDDFPLWRLLPRDSLGLATGLFAVRGRGFDPLVMEAEVEVTIDRFDYKTVDLGRITADITAAKGLFTGRVRSDNDLLTTDVTLTAGIVRDTIVMAGATDLAPMSYTLAARIDSTVVSFGGGRHKIAPVVLRAEASGAGSSASLLSGDMTLDVSSPLPPDSLIDAAGVAGSEVMRQLAARNFCPDSLQSALPALILRAQAGRNNFVHDLAELHGVGFRTLSADVSSGVDTPFHIDAMVTGVAMGSLEADTLALHAVRGGPMLDYEVRLANHPSTLADLGLIRVAGSAGGRAVTAEVLQRSSGGTVGFDFGLRASLEEDGAIRAEIAEGPLLGYDRWRVEPEANWIEYGADGLLRADLHLESAGGEAAGEVVEAVAEPHSKHIVVTSASLPGIPQGALRLNAKGLDIERMLDLVPTAPDVGGLFSSDITFGFHSEGEESIIAARGVVGAEDFAYAGRRIADVDADVDFSSDGTGRMVLDASVTLDERSALTAQGTYAAGAIDFDVVVPALPLSIAEGFLPDETATLKGALDGHLHIAGNTERPLLTGDVGFTDAAVDVAMIGTAFGISPERITIADNRVTFNNFGLIAPNNRRLAVNGSVGIADLAAPDVDLAIRARDFQYVNSKHIGGSQIYGTAALDAALTVKGKIDAMSVRGDIALDGATNIVYIMRGSDQKVRDERQHIVQFVSFADSLSGEQVDIVLPAMGGAGIDILLGVDIEDGLKATLSLDELNENRVELVGGGDLSFSMNRQGDTRLAGRYTLSGGTLYYKPPLIPQKVFAVADGSYVEWTGAPAAPAFHVTATQTMHVMLDYDDGSSREVAFDISVAVAGSLEAIEMVFDVAAPSDIAIQDQLLSMSDEGRMQQALTLLIYNRYTGPGVSSKGMAFDAQGQINDFISKEINQWARNNLKGVDFQMGIDSSGEAGGGSHTDYSYNVSKTLFSDRVKISIGGKVSDGAGASEGLADNLLEDATLEYRLTRRDNMFLKIYRYNTRESILEGEVTETGGGFVISKKVNRLGDLFRRTRPRRVRDGARDRIRDEVRDERK